MAKSMIVAQFHEYGAAHRALSELIQSGVVPEDISLVAGDRSDRLAASRDFGILGNDAEAYVGAVRRGITLLAVRAGPAQRARVARILGRYAPMQIDDPAQTGSVTLSGAPADRGASPGELPRAGRGDWLVEEEGELAAEMDPERG